LVDQGLLTGAAASDIAVDGEDRVFLVIDDQGDERLVVEHSSQYPPLYSVDVANGATFALSANGTLVAFDSDGVHGWRTKAPSVYCTAKLSSSFCSATMTSSQPGGGPVSGVNDYSVLTNAAQGQRAGVIFSTIWGSQAVPFLGGTLCLKSPVARSPMLWSGGTNGACDGTFALTINDGVSPTDPDFPGLTVWFQTWFRDPSDPVWGVALSDALELSY
jgi:hypothetical protein